MSDVLIRGMEMPKEETVLLLITPNGSVWKINRDEREDELIAEAIEVPDHGRLIDADKVFLTDFEIIMCENNYNEALKMLLQKIDAAQTIIPADKEEKT